MTPRVRAPWRWVRSALLVLAGGGWIGCHGTDLPLDPTISAASTSGPTVKAPSNTNAVSVSQSRIDVSWQDNSSNETGFEVWRAQGGPGGPFNQLVAASANTTAHHDAGLAASTQYCYQVRAFRAYDGKTSYSAFSATACATTPAAPPPPPLPAPPVSLSAGNLIQYGLSNILLEWRAGSDNQDGFKVERCGGVLCGDADFTLIATLGATSSFLVDTQFEPGSTYTYRVRAFNSSGDSAPSPEATGTACYVDVDPFDGFYTCFLPQ